MKRGGGRGGASLRVWRLRSVEKKGRGWFKSVKKREGKRFESVEKMEWG